MGELDRNSPETPSPLRCAVVGRGRLGTTLSTALRDAGHRVDGPLGRGAAGEGADLALLCVPDTEIASAAAAVGRGPIVGHCSGALGLDVLGDRERLSLHPLMTVTDAGADLHGAGCAIDGSSPRARAVARRIAESLGMEPVEVAEADRAAYHAAASIASNYLVALESAAERLGATAGLSRAQLVALVRATVDNWAALGPERALTGPLVRGDEATVSRQRDTVAERAPDLLDLFDVMAQATRDLAARQAAAV